jgi:hypothetical protein
VFNTEADGCDSSYPITYNTKMLKSVFSRLVVAHVKVSGLCGVAERKGILVVVVVAHLKE